MLKVEPDKRRLALSFRGPMPEDLRLRAEAAARGGKDSMSAEDRELASVWRDYEAQRQAAANAPDAPPAGALPGSASPQAAGGGAQPTPATSFAAAFATARKRGQN